MLNWDGPEISFILDRALAEDVGTGDITTRTIFPEPPGSLLTFLQRRMGLSREFR